MRIYHILCKLVLISGLLKFAIQKELENDSIIRLLKKINQQLIVHANICWSINEKVKLVKSLSSIMVASNINENLENLYFPGPNIAHVTTFVVDLRCKNVYSLLENAGRNLGFGSPFKWILLSNESSISNISQSFLKNIPILPDSDVNLIMLNSQQSFNSFLTLYKWNENSEVITGIVSNKPLAVQRLNIQQCLIKICYVLTNNDTINHLSDYRNKETDTITKVNFILTNHLIDYLNGSRDFSYVSSWGYKDSTDGSWSGMIGQLTRKEADIGGSPLFFTSDRVSVIDYIAMPTPTRSKFVFRQPKLSYMSNVFILPFRFGVWASSVALVMVLIIFIYISSKWEWFRIPLQKNNDSETLRPILSDAIMMTVGAVCQQGSSTQMKNITGRIVILLLFLSLMFLYTSYSANIVALLQSSSSRIKTLSDLLGSRLKLGVHDTVFNRYYFSTASEPIRKAIYREKIAAPGKKPNFMSLEEGVKRLREGLFAFHMETGVGYKVVSETFHEGEKCGLREIQYLQVIDPWLAVQKNSSYKEMFKIGKIHEHGLQTRENSLLYTKKPKCTGTGSNFISVGIIDCEPAMMILAYGAVLALILLILEILKYRRSNKGDNKLSNGM